AQQHRTCPCPLEEPRLRPHGPAWPRQGAHRLFASRRDPQSNVGNQPPRTKPPLTSPTSHPAPADQSNHHHNPSLSGPIDEKTYRPDVAIRVGVLNDSSLTAKRIAP